MKLIHAEGDVAAQDETIAKIIGDHLYKHYPKHLWAITASGKNGLATIKCLDLPMDRGYVLHIKTTYSSSELEHRAMIAAGEILERYGMTRGEFRVDELANLPTDKLGRIIGDIS
ncbi:MAG: hypothetical protein AB8B85_02720 [Paracoccaceae bacterium]